MTEPAKITIEICMGSSCFARGNESNLMQIENYIASHKLEDRIELKGSLCMGQCNSGPSLRINDKMYHHVDAGTVLDLIAEHLTASGA